MEAVCSQTLTHPTKPSLLYPHHVETSLTLVLQTQSAEPVTHLLKPFLIPFTGKDLINESLEEWPFLYKTEVHGVMQNYTKKMFISL
jgi:hypothetical protein